MFISEIRNKELICFAQLLAKKDRKKINIWKTDMVLIDDDDRLLTDIETIEYLLRNSFARCYITYIEDDDAFDFRCKFKNSKSKDKFIEDWWQGG
tara:strand:- start:941 stop:1225 length:285 start_codon:yes stop_codon:yes gene_type:complete